jgi:OOP family OmpA-OmpF porin
VECTQTNRDELVNCLAPNRRVEIDFVRDEG